MFFGLIETKKDKRIKELENELDLIKGCKPLITMTYDMYNTELLQSSYELYYEDMNLINEEQIKNFLCSQMCSILKDSMRIEYETDDMRRIKTYRGYVRICK